MGTFSDLGSSRNSPSAPSNEPHTSPVPGYEAVEATGVASVGAIEPASSSQSSDGGGHQTRKGGRPVTGRTSLLNAPTGSHRLNSLTNEPPLRQAERKDSAWCARSDREKFWGVCSRPKSHTEFTNESIRTTGERVCSGRDVAGGRVPRRVRRVDASGPSQARERGRTKRKRHSTLITVGQSMEIEGHVVQP